MESAHARPVPSRADGPMRFGVLLAAAPLFLPALIVRAGSLFRAAMQPHQMDCAETGSFLGGAIPSEATDISCPGCSVDFRLPHDRAGALLTAAYPRLTEADPSTCVADLCPEGGADGTADVHIDAYDV